ncbi:hypothetical protein BS78_K100600 [Paspalum vaginatum]|uniref:GATA-type domain-containing protein n=1 Tax=Paspalum vaginatum TaxID=158149 RepID=A0A9W7X8W5_9POAL|nr:hypothetical protein BS78_K100600 [Paspalum vaginatum]
MEALKRLSEEEQWDGFWVDDLLDLEGFCEADGDEMLPLTSAVVAADQRKLNGGDSQQSSVVPYELPVPELDGDELEWLLSRIMDDDSHSKLPLTPQPPSMVATSFAARPPVLAPVKAKRSKRSRASVWRPLSAAGPHAIGGRRRCNHCSTSNTPQWRAGPEGKRTLCNACGIRYRSGGLFPEYRPARSPTFLSTVHSNSFRKVLKIRRKKNVTATT